MNDKPVAWIDKRNLSMPYPNSDQMNCWGNSYPEQGIDIPLYLRPSKQLSDEEIEEIIRKHWNREYGNRNMMTFARAIIKEITE